MKQRTNALCVVLLILLVSRSEGQDYVAYFNGTNSYALSDTATWPSNNITVDLRFWYIPTTDSWMVVGATDELKFNRGWVIFYDYEPWWISEGGVPGINAGWAITYFGSWTDCQAVLTEKKSFDTLHPHVLTVVADAPNNIAKVFLDGQMILDQPNHDPDNPDSIPPLQLLAAVSRMSFGALKDENGIHGYAPMYISDLRVSDITRSNNYPVDYPFVDDEHVVAHWSSAASDPNGNILIDIVGSNNACFYGLGPHFVTPPQPTNDAPVVTAIEVVGQDIELSFMTGLGRYAVEYSQDLSDWSILTNDIQGVDEVISITDTGALVLDNRFYRIRLNL